MGKLFHYIGRIVQAAGLLLILNALIVSALRNESMGFLFKFTLVGMTIFMIGWTLQKYS
ncbi:MAG TPA: hypothetical protein VI382_05115 [Candidatus Manganitrophaceae bacterium]|nr:hypothetical protein [Candidatus Manganitrophaceae bacterium]